MGEGGAWPAINGSRRGLLLGTTTQGLKRVCLYDPCHRSNLISTFHNVCKQWGTDRDPKYYDADAVKDFYLSAASGTVSSSYSGDDGAGPTSSNTTNDSVSDASVDTDDKALKSFSGDEAGALLWPRKTQFILLWLHQPTCFPHSHGLSFPCWTPSAHAPSSSCRTVEFESV